MKNGNPSLNFLKNKNVIYYAGLDEKGLPFHESARKILGLSIKNITYLKALSLVADHVVVPPTFFFFCIPAEEGRVYHKQLLPLFSERHVLTTVYGGLNKTRDFLALKKEKGFEDEI